MNLIYTKSMRRVLCLLAAMSMLSATSCLRETSEVSESGGIGRETQPKIEETDPPVSPDETQKSDETSGYTPPPLDNPELDGDTTETDETDETDGDPSTVWEIKDSKYVYNLPERDKTAQNDLSDMANFSRGFFEDQPEGFDWFYGPTTYNEATGEVTYSWDRYQSTLDTIDKYHTIYRGDTERKVIYLTFDCGYEFGPTADILDTLKEKQAPGIFFLTGQYVEEEDELIRRMIDEGHIIGNHTVNHWRATELTAQQIVDQVQGLEDMFTAKFPDADPMIYYRPPYGNCNEYSLKVVDKMGYTSVMWSYTYKDYDTDNQLSYDDAMAKVKSGLHPGAVYLFHTESTTNAAILGDFIDWVRLQGYEILPICDITFD